MTSEKTTVITSAGEFRLTNRELEILCLVAEGNSNKIIGSILNLSERTVKSHLTYIFARTKARDRTHAVVLAYRAGLIDILGKDKKEALDGNSEN